MFRISCIFDVMIIIGKNDEEYFVNLKEVLCSLQIYGLRVKKIKYEFFNEKIIFCGYDIDNYGFYKILEKVEVVF